LNGEPFNRGSAKESCLASVLFSWEFLAAILCPHLRLENLFAGKRSRHWEREEGFKVGKAAKSTSVISFERRPMPLLVVRAL